ncbi:cysteine hydrolase family protein [Embleya sp. NBC_00896]|uniref:cysteine hydrolase family protein n=1 Tax=Embleya sp. NBC_00896 TaxID=2975961 RepID=UPI00386F42F6|nr:cysteine hydrolase [Embleya sp. NBC_00896]
MTKNANATAEAPVPTVADDAVLILVDVQKGFDRADVWGERNNPDAEANIAALVAAWERTGRPIVLVRHDSVESSPLHPDDPGNAFKDVVAAVKAELLVTKQVNSAFYGTPDLHAWLTARGANQIVIAGIQTNMCNETTARMAGNLGYDVLFPIDAMHTFGLTGPDGDTMTADELSRATATSLHGGGFAKVVRTADLLAATE